MNDFEGLDDPPADLPPWERAGAVRRDCVSHRGQLLGPLGKAALLLGFASICCSVGFLVSLPLGLATWLVARHDLAAMTRGQMDPAGRRQTGRAADDGRFAFWFSLIGLTFVLWMLAWALFP